MRLLWTPAALPRSTTRAQWRELDRWRRTTERRLREASARALENFAAYGATMPAELRLRAAERLANPPLLVHPAMEPTLFPCAVCGAPYGHSPSCASRWRIDDPRLVALFTKIGRELGDPGDMAELDRRFDEAREGGA